MAIKGTPGNRCKLMTACRMQLLYELCWKSSVQSWWQWFNITATLWCTEYVSRLTTQQSFNRPLSMTTWLSRYRKKHSPTHPPTIHSILPVQITCLAIFLHNLSPRRLRSTSWSGALHLIFHTISSPDQCLLFAIHALMPISLQGV